jgi:hypothetical protein
MLGAIIGAGISVAASAIGAAIGNARRRKAREALEKSQQEQLEELNAEINSDYLNSAEASNAIRKVTEANEESLRQLNTDAIRSGATEEAKVAMASQLGKQTAGVVGDLSAIGERRKNALKQERRYLKGGYAEQAYALDSDTSGIDSLMSTIGSAAQSIGNAWESRTPEAMTLESDPVDTTKIEGQAKEALKGKMPIEVDPDASNVEKHKVKQYGSRR